MTSDITPWDRLPEETALWWNRFEIFRMIGYTRTNYKAYSAECDKVGKKKAQKLPGSWHNASIKYNWRERAEAWDATLVEQRRQEWATRQEAWREQEWQLAEKMHQKVVDMLVFPVARVTREQDGKVTTIEPANWKIADIPKIASVVSKLARLASGMATERTEAIDWDPGQLTDEELEEIEATGNVKAVLARRKQGQGNGNGEGSASAPLQLPEA